MSSHHIVRDQQEPALIVEDISEFPIKTLNEILGWSPTVVCLEKSIIQFAAYGLKIDHLVVDKTSMNTFAEMLSYQWPFQIHEKIKQPLVQAIEILNKNEHTSINVLCNSSYLSELIQELLPFHEIDFCVFTETKKVLLHKKSVFSKWFPKGSFLGVQSIVENTCFSTKGLVDDLNNKMTDVSYFSEVKEDGKVSISGSNVPFMIFESYN
ncbi:MAG: hypothetical protein RIA69_00790 [Cyclobacteriaceae bacterium]